MLLLFGQRSLNKASNFTLEHLCAKEYVPCVRRFVQAAGARAEASVLRCQLVDLKARFENETRKLQADAEASRQALETASMKVILLKITSIESFPLTVACRAKWYLESLLTQSSCTAEG